jgi:PAS domain S-box-containing protein
MEHDQLDERVIRKILSENKERYHLIFSQMLNGFALHEMIFDENGKPIDYRFLEVNPAFERLTGLRRENLIGRTVRQVMPDIEPYWIETYGQVAQSETPISFHHFAGPLNKYYQVNAYSPQPGQFATIFADITEQKWAEKVLKVLLEIMQGLATTHDLQQFLQLIHHSIAKVIYAENFFVVLFHKNTGLFEEIYAVDKYDLPMPPSKLEKSITSYVFRTSAPLLVTQKRFDDLAARGEVELVGTNSASWLGAPLKTPKETIGVIAVQNYGDPDSYSERDKEFLTSVGAQVAIAIERKIQEEDLKQKMDELERFNNLTVDRELRMIELKKEINNLLKKIGEMEKYQIV